MTISYTRLQVVSALQRFCVATIFTCMSFQSLADDMRPYISGGYRAVVIEGKIEPGDFATFSRILRENNGQVSTVFCFSPGGDFYEAMKIGRAMRALELNSVAPTQSASGRPVCDAPAKPNDPKNCTCASAGFFLHIGGEGKFGTYLAAHRPYFEKGRFGNLSEINAKAAFDALQSSARDYMTEMGVPPHVQEEVLGTPSDRNLFLDERTIKTYFSGDLPYHREWLANRCGALSSSEKQRSNVYSARLRVGGKLSAFSTDERSDFDALQEKEHAERKCVIAVTDQSRLAAYERYFHEKPNAALVRTNKK